MRWRWLSSIRVRVLAVVVGLLVLSSVGSVLLLWVVLYERLDDEISLGLEREAEEFSLLAEGVDPRTGEPFGDDVRAIFDVYFDREIPDEGEILLAFFDGDLYDSRRASAVPNPDEFQPSIDYWVSLDRPESGTLVTPAGPAQYVVLPLGGAPAGMMVIVNFPAFERGEIDEAVQTQLIVQFGTTILASIIGLALAGRILRPLRALAETALTISEADLSQRINTHGHRDEASQIAEAFNDMLTRLEGSFTTQRQFLDDTSHELRTPLTIIRGHIELLELDKTAEQRRQTIALVVAEIDRMNDMVTDLFLLARAEQPDFVHLEHLDVQALLRSVHQKMTVMAQREWQLQLPESSTQVFLDPNRITQALLQLADNAVKHTAPGEVIELGADLTAGSLMIWVADCGPGISGADKDRIFERFQKGAIHPGSRKGAGLGLSIVAAIAAAHHGKVTVVPEPGWGAYFLLTLPR